MPLWAALFGKSHESNKLTEPAGLAEEPVKLPVVESKPAKKKASYLISQGLFDDEDEADDDDIFSFSEFSLCVKTR